MDEKWGVKEGSFLTEFLKFWGLIYRNCVIILVGIKSSIYDKIEIKESRAVNIQMTVKSYCPK